MKVTVSGPARLHFGLLHVPTPGTESVRKFGGCGLMIRGPGVTVTAEFATAWDASGPSAGRALDYAERFAETLPGGDRPVRIVVEACPPEHVGLGIGTQLGLAVAEAVAGLHRVAFPAEELARRGGRGGRGGRSGVGVFGFRRGGFVADGGHSPGGPAAVVARHPFPENWRIVLARPAGLDRWHGDAERSAFARPRDVAAAARTTDALCRILMMGLLPAVVEADFAAFGDSLFAYNRLAGEAFAADQGGVYAGPRVTAVVDHLRAIGVTGVGQSSWGPTVFAFAESVGEAESLVARLRADVPDLEDVSVAAADNAGAAIRITQSR